MDERLIDLGFAPEELSPSQRTQLDESGFAIFESVIDPAWREKLQQAFEQVFEREGEQAGKEVSQVEGVRRLADLVNKGEVYDQVYLQPALLAAVWQVLQRPFKLHSLNAHEPLLGHGQQVLHADWGGARETGTYHVVNSMWMLDDMTADNGATRVVPGSHRFPGVVGEEVEDRMTAYPGEVYLTASAGSVGVFNGSAWHSCTQNSSGQQRRVLHCAFIAREHRQQTDQREYLNPETDRRLTPLARYVLDV